MRFKSIFLILLVLLLFSFPAFAQEQRGAIEGVVTDSTGAVLPGVTVEATSPRMPGVATAVTNERGRYRFPALPPGTYEITARLPGFSDYVVSGVALGLGELLDVNMILEIAGMAETVTVTGESPLIDTKQSDTSHKIDQEIIDSVPKGRDFTSLVTIAPGANEEPKVAGVSIDGAPATENRYIIDGIDTTGLFDGKPAKMLITDHLEEVQVKSSGYNAEFGGATGGVINVITKTGSNNFRGSALMYFLHDALISSPRPTLRLDPQNDRQSEYITYDEDGYRRIEPGFTLGGPIARDRAWFFASYIPQIERTQRTVDFLATGTSGDFEQTNNTHYFTTNVSAQISDTVRSRFSLTLNPRYERGVLPVLAGTDDPRTTDFAALGEDRPNTSFSANVDWLPNDSFYINARGGYFDYDLKQLGRPEEIKYTFSGSNNIYPEIPEDLVQPSGYTNLSTNRAYQKNKLARLQLHGDVTYYAEAAGSHTFKAGIQFDRPENGVLEGNSAPEIIFYWDRTRTTLAGERLRGEYGYYRGVQRLTLGDIHSNDMALFFQDSWTIADKLTLNLGIRTEKQTIPSYSDQGVDIKFGFGDKISPRLGFAYDLNGKTKFYGSYGNFFDSMKLNLPRGLFGGELYKIYYFTLDTYEWNTIGQDGCIPPSDVPKVDNPTCPGTFIDYFDARIPSNDPSNNYVDPGLKPMESREWTFGMEHELNVTTSLGVRYVHKELVRTIEDVGTIVPGEGERYFIANPGFGVAEYTIGREFPPQPKAQRDYDSVEFRLRRRFANNWAVNVSYLWSRLWGTYAGLSNSDELQVSEGGSRPVGEGRSSPNTNRIYDAIVMAFDDNAQPVIGNLSTERPHQFKAQATYGFDFGTTVGMFAYVASGTPVSRITDVQSSTFVFYQGRLSDGRTPTYSNFDLHVAHRFNMGPGDLELRLNVRNLFDQKNVTSIWNEETREPIARTNEEFFAGYDTQALIEEQGIRRDPRFLQDWLYQYPREIRIGFAYIW